MDKTSVRSVIEKLQLWCTFHNKGEVETNSKRTFNLAKTLWPVSQIEVMFLPEYPIKNVFKSQFTVLDTISKGGYGVVHKVEEISTKKIFALKIMYKAKIVLEGATEGAINEASILKTVAHHNFIVTLSQHWQSRKSLYMLMEYVDGGELFSLVEEYGVLPEDAVRIFIGEIALALDFLFNLGIIHRDIKATNVLLDNQGHTKLIDFGFAKWLSSGQKTGSICGTCEFIAPEIVQNKNYGHEVDWWSLGVLACFLLTTKYPSHVCSGFTVESLEIADDELGKLPEEAASLSKAAKDLLQRLLTKNPTLRIKSVLAMQKIAFYFRHDIHSYNLKLVSPFNYLNKSHSLNRRHSVILKIIHA